MRKFIAIHKHKWGVNVYAFATPSECLTGFPWKEENKLKLAERLDIPYTGEHHTTLTIVEYPDTVVISENDAAQIWAADDTGN